MKVRSARNRRTWDKVSPVPFSDVRNRGRVRAIKVRRADLLRITFCLCRNFGMSLHLHPLHGSIQRSKLD
jgi:hypothetical protein